MPVAFHPPLDHPIDMPQVARGAEEAPTGDLFAALLASAGKAPLVVDVDAAKAEGDARKDVRDAAAFDPLNLFAAWPGAQSAIGASADPGAAPPRASIDPDGKGTARRVANATTDAAAATGGDAPVAQAHADGTAAFNGRAAPPRRPNATHAHDIAAAQSNETPATTSRNDRATTANVAASFVAAALLVKTPDAGTPGVTGASATEHRDGADAAPGVNLGTSAAAPAVSLARPIAEPVGSPGFATQVAGEIAQLVHINADRAQLHVHPADMGPIDVTMSVRNDQVTVTMVAADPQTRAALELALPQLRDLLANQGLALANASVNDHAPRNDNRQGAQHAAARGDARVDGIAAAPAAHLPSSLALRRLVDLYA